MANNRMDGNAPPILFVVGSGRSGTTVYHSYLDSYDALQSFPRLAAAEPRLTRLAGVMQQLPRAPQSLVRPSSEAQKILEEAGISVTAQQSLRRRLKAPDCSMIKSRILEKRARQLLRANRRATTVTLKNTLNSARVEALASAFPNATFHHVIRHPGRVIESLLNVEFFNSMTLWWDGRTVNAYAADERVSREIVAARHWSRQVQDCLDGLESVSGSKQSTVSYPQFTRDPLSTTRSALTQVGIHDLQISRRAPEVRGERAAPLKQETLAAVEAECGTTLSRLDPAIFHE